MSLSESPWTASTKIRCIVKEELNRILYSSLDTVNWNLSFIQMGGHSLGAAALSQACKRRRVALSVENILLSQNLFQLVHCGTEIASPLSASLSLEQYKSSDVVSVSPLAPRPGFEAAFPPSKPHDPVLGPTISSLYPITNSATQTAVMHNMVTEMQLTLIQGTYLYPRHNIVRYHTTYLSIDLPLIERAWRAVIDLEPMLRTNFDTQNGNFVLATPAEASPRWDEIVVHTSEAYEQELEEKDLQIISSASFKVVTLDRGPQHEKTSTVIWSIHHALIDGYSASLILSKVCQAASGRPLYPGRSFFEVAANLRDLQETSSGSSKLFWEKQRVLSSATADKIVLPRPASQTTGNGRPVRDVSVQLPLSIVSSYAQSMGASAASVYYGAWAILLSKYMDSDAVAFGIVLSGRNLPLEGAESTIGPLINTLPFFVSLQTRMKTTEYLRYMFAHMVELGSFSFSIPEDGFSRDFSSAMAMEVVMANSEPNEIQPITDAYYEISPTIPLSVIIGSTNQIRLIYHTNRYSQTDIKMLAANYCKVILAMMVPYHTVGDCMESIVSEECREKLLRLGNYHSDATLPSSVHDDLVSLFDRTAKTYPEVIAIEKGNLQLTYKTLSTRANQVSQRLTTLVKPGDFVGVHADRTIGWVVAIYGILKAGGIYCPLDPTLPSGLRDANFQSAGCKLFLTSGNLEKRFQPKSCTLCLSVEEILSSSDMSTSPLGFGPNHVPRPEATAYVCFTSGSQGKPKGVICSHEGLVAFQKDLEVRLFASPHCRISQIMSPAFDGSIHELFSALSYGATLVLANSADPFAHLDTVDSAILTPSIARLFSPEDFPKLLNVYLVGEAVPQFVNDLWADTKRLYNMYGPTEGTCGATIKRLYPGQPVDIGRPNPSSRLYILDRNQGLVPPGATGEIYIAGVQVARGYVDRPEETTGRFLVDHVYGSGQMYRTGDRGYWNSSDCVTCLGRVDRQIKLRGFRLDLDDLEFRISQLIPEASGVAVFVEKDHLVAAVIPGWLNPLVLRARIAETLPSYAIPDYVVALNKFPLTLAGKFDQKAIMPTLKPSPEPATKSRMTPSESLVASAWYECLEMASDIEINQDSSFVALGANSIKQLLLASRLATLFHRRIPFQMIYQFPTLRKLAAAIDGFCVQESVVFGVQSGLTLGEHGVSPIEEEWWHKYNLGEDSSAFNVSYVCALHSEMIDRSRLAEAWNAVIKRYRVLRSRYIRLGQPSILTRILSKNPPRAHIVSEIDIRREINRTFHLESDDPISVMISKDHLLVCVSHIVCDLTTLKILLREMTLAYTGAQLPPIQRTYADTGVWSNAASRSDLAFWTKYLETSPKPRATRQRPSSRHSYGGRSHACKLPRGIFARLRSFVDDTGFSFHQVALAAVALALEVTSDDIDITIGSPYLNRQSTDLDTVGLFLEPLPIRIQHVPDSIASPSTAFLQAVQDSVQAALSHVLPWTQLLQHLGADIDFPNQPLFDVMVTFHDDRSSPALMPLPGLEPIITWTEGAKFKLMCEFCAVSEETILLRLEFDTDLFSDAEMLGIADRISEAIECLTGKMPYIGLRTRLREVANFSPLKELNHDDLFGQRVGTL